jgi:RNA polymerase sigma-70 factor, ECF subfamily
MNCSPSPARGAPGHATELLEAQIPGLRRYAYALLHGDREGADDLVQDSLERALSCWHQRRRDGDLRGWIYTILYHRFLTDRRRQRRNVGRRSLTGILEPEQPGVEGGQEGALAYRDLLRGFAELPEEQRSVLFLVAVDDFTYREAAGILGVPIGTVMSRLSRGREHLRQYMNGGQARALPEITNAGDTRSDGQCSARLGRPRPSRNCSAVRRMAATQGVPTIAD